MPTVSELKDRAREFEQKGELGTALKIYRHIISHLEGTPALAAEIPLYVKVGDLSGKLGRGVEAVAAYRAAGEHFAATGSARSLNALALKVQRVDPAQRDDVYGHFARDLLAHGHDDAAAEVLGQAVERAGLARMGEALAWARERPEEEARGVLLRLAEALAQGAEAAEVEAGAIVAPPAPAPPPTPAPPPPAPPAEEVMEEAPVEEAPVEEAPVEEAPVEEAPVEEAPVEEAPVGEEPLRIERSVEPEPAASDLPVMWSPDELGQDRPARLPTDWSLPPETPAPPVEPPPVEPPLPPPPAPPEPLAMASIAPSAYDAEPLVTEPPVPPPAPPPAFAEPVPERAPVRRSAPYTQVPTEERRRDRGRPWVAVTGLVVVVGVLAAAAALGLIPLGGGGSGADRRAPRGAASDPPPPDTSPGVPAGPGGGNAAGTASPAGGAVPETTGVERATDTAALPPPLDSLALPPVSVPRVVVPSVAPPPAPVDTTTRGPPTVRVPAGTTIRDWLIVVPGLTVESAVTVPLNGRTGRRVVQRLSDGEPLVLTAAPMAGADTVGVSDVRITVAGDTTAGSVRFWSSLVTARARVNPDTLARLLRRLVRARPVR